MNGLVNQRLLERRVVDTLFVPPFTDDRGLAVGAAALAAYEQGAPVRAVPGSISPFLGPAAADAAAADLAFTRRVDGEDALVACAADLSRGAIVGWFEGRDEAGPRALGHRSILASPVPAGMRDRLNLEIKRREPFRPFGCSILREHVHVWFECSDDSPYMLRIVRARAERRAAIAAALHVDGTSRLHTVTPARLPRLARLLELLFPLTPSEEVLLLLPERSRWDRQLRARPVGTGARAQYDDDDARWYTRFEDWIARGLPVQRIDVPFEEALIGEIAR